MYIIIIYCHWGRVIEILCSLIIAQYKRKILKVSLLEFEQNDQMQKDKNNFCCCNFNLSLKCIKS